MLEADVDALVNTVNTVGIMGKGIALMFKEAFPENYSAYKAACDRGDVRVGRMFVTEPMKLSGPKWIINFPTKKDWRHPSKMEWIVEGLDDLKKVISEKKIRSIALPPLGSGNGRLDWQEVRSRITGALGSMSDVNIVIYEPTAKYQNVAKRAGVEKLTPARALIAELVRRYWVLGIDCTLLEVQKLAYFLERHLLLLSLGKPLDLQFEAGKFGPYASRLTHLLDALDGSYLHCSKRLADAGPLDTIWFEDSRADRVATYLASSEAKPYVPALDATSRLIDGFESPLGMELLSTVDWLLAQRGADPTVSSVKRGLAAWPGGDESAERKLRIFDDRLVKLAIDRLAPPVVH